MADGLPFKFAARLGGISIDTFCEWRKQIPEFSEAVEAAVARGVQERLKLVNAAAKKGDLRAAMWWLEHVLPEHFARNRIEHGGQVGLSVEPKMSDETLQRLRVAYRMKIRREVEEELRNAKALTSGSGAVVRVPVEATHHEAASLIGPRKSVFNLRLALLAPPTAKASSGSEGKPAAENVDVVSERVPVWRTLPNGPHQS